MAQPIKKETRPRLNLTAETLRRVSIIARKENRSECAVMEKAIEEIADRLYTDIVVVKEKA